MSERIVSDRVIQKDFYSTHEWREYMRSLNRWNTMAPTYDSWAGNSWDGFLQDMAKGASEHEQAHIRRTMEKLDTSIQDRTIRQTVSDVAGYNPCVPEYLMGLPTHMRRKEMVQTRLAPVRIYMDMFISASCNDSEIANRAAAAAALAARLATDRAVELWLCWSYGVRDKAGNIISAGRVRVSTAPVHLAELTFLTSKQASRIGTFTTVRNAAGLSCGRSKRATLPEDITGLPHTDYANTEREIRERFHLSDNDIVVNPIRLHDTTFDTPERAIRWANEQLARQAKYNETY